MTERLRHAIRTAVRSLATSRGVVAAAVLTLAIAAGLNLAMFGLIDRAILSPAAHVADPAQVFTLAFERGDDDRGRRRMTTTSYVAFEAIREHVPGEAAAWQRVTTGAIVNGAQFEVDAMLVSGSYFGLLGAAPRVGRVIATEDDTAPNGSPVAVLSHAFWTRIFGGDADAIGQRIVVRGVEMNVIGVMPAGFSGHSSVNVDVWLPIHAAMQEPGWYQNQFINIVSVLVRVPDGETPASTSAQAGAVTNARVTLLSIHGTEIGATERRIAYWLGAVSLLVLTIGLANTGTLLLVRGAARRSEFMIRIALGATPGRLRSQVLLEAALLASIATAAALLLSVWLDEVVRRLLLPTVSASAGPTERILLAAGVAGGLAFAVAILAGIGQMPRSHVALPASYRRGRAHVALLVFQTTVSVILLAGAGLFGRSLYTLAAQDLGMRTDDVLLVQFDRGGRAADQDERFATALDRIRALPGVQLAAPIKTMPFTGFNVPPIGVPGLAGPPNINGQLPFLTAAAPEFFEILDIRIVEGRRFVDTDDRGAPVVIINETMARTLWPGHSALGKCIRIGFEPSFDPFSAGGPPVPTTLPCREVVGVARDVRQRSVVPTGAETRLMQYFVPFSQVPPPPTGVNPGGRVEIYGLLLRATAGPEQLAPAIRRLIVGDRTDLPFLQVRRYAELQERQIRPWRLGTALLVLFGALALAVAAVGLYAAFAHSVSERRRELAIRIAIGAQPQGVLRMILREAAVFAIAGVLIGSAVVAVGGRSLESMLFGTAPTDPVVLGSVGVLMVIVAGIATFLPALRAARSDPSSLLRAE